MLTRRGGRERGREHDDDGDDDVLLSLTVVRVEDGKAKAAAVIVVAVAVDSVSGPNAREGHRASSRRYVAESLILFSCSFYSLDTPWGFFFWERGR